MNRSNLQTLSALVDAIYEAAFDAALWPSVIEALRAHCNGSHACLGRHGGLLGADDLICADPNPEFHASYLAEYHRENVLWDRLAATPVGEVRRDSDLINLETLHKSRLWNEWMAPQDMHWVMNAKIRMDDGGLWVLDMERGQNQGAFDTADAALLGLVIPHIARATRISGRFRLEQQLATTLSMLPFGALVVDETLRVQYLNATAEELLSDPAMPLGCRARVLTAQDRNAARQFAAAVRQMCTADHPPTSGMDLLLAAPHDRPEPAGHQALAVSVLPLPPSERRSWGSGSRCALLFVRHLAQTDASHLANSARALFGLTPREAQLAAALMAGHSLKQAAADLSIRISTARTYLEQIFAKTGVRQQTQLVALLKTAFPLRHQDP